MFRNQLLKARILPNRIPERTNDIYLDAVSFSTTGCFASSTIFSKRGSRAANPTSDSGAIRHRAPGRPGFGNGFKLVKGQVSFAYPGTDHGKVCLYASLIIVRPEHCFLGQAAPATSGGRSHQKPDRLDRCGSPSAVAVLGRPLMLRRFVTHSARVHRGWKRTRAPSRRQ